MGPRTRSNNNNNSSSKKKTNASPKKKKEEVEQPPESSESESEAESQSESGSSESGSFESGSDSEGSASGSDESSSSSSRNGKDDEAGGNKDNTKGFTDENSSWLKPKSTTTKKQLLDDSDSSSNGSSSNEDESGDEEASSSSDEELEIERESKLLDSQLLIEQSEAATELQHTILHQSSTFHLPTPDELTDETDGTRVVPPSELRERIDEILGVLGDFGRRREEGRSRSEYTGQLEADLSELFGYLPELVSYLSTMFNPSETLEFLTASDTPRPLVIRTNTLRARRKDLAASLMKRGVTLDPLASWSKVGLKITASPVPIGATPEYLSGQYMLQSAASFCPCLALNPGITTGKKKEVVLDMSAAPGGKTSYLSQLMRNTGVVIANDLKPDRQKSTVANMARLGVKNVIACAMDGRKIGTLWKNRFTKVLLDAPCSGLGVVSRDPSVKVQRTMRDIDRCQVLQKELILSAIDALDHKSKGPGDEGGGVLVYSTCSVAVKENEEVVDYLLQHRDVKLLEMEVLDFGKVGFTRYQGKRFHPSLSKTRRFYPHVHNMDGFYVAKILKLSDRKPKDGLGEEEADKEEVGDEMEVEGEEGTDETQDKKEDWGARIKHQQQSKRAKQRAAGKKPKRRDDNNNKNKPTEDTDQPTPEKMRSKVAKKPQSNGNGGGSNDKKRRRANSDKVNKPRRRKAVEDLGDM